MHRKADPAVSIDLHTDATLTGTTDSIGVPPAQAPRRGRPHRAGHRDAPHPGDRRPGQGPAVAARPTCPPAADRDRVRARLIELYIPLAEYLARRFRNRGEQFDDLVQVANLGLIKSVDGYDPTRGAAFTSYAIPMIVGELKRHFRDKGWDVRVPRRLQELRLEISKVSGDLAQDLGRSPTVADLARSLGVSEEDVIEGLDCGQAYRALSLDAPAGEDGDGGATGLGDLLGGDDPDMPTSRTARRCARCWRSCRSASRRSSRCASTAT